MEKVIKQIEKEKLIVIVRGVAKDKLIPLTEALYDGGVRLMEITYDSNGVTTDEETAKNIDMLVKHFEGRMFIGAGTVTKTNQVELTKKAGGTFIISPDTYVDVIKKTKEVGMVSIPGALTPSEVAQAHRAGADFIKLFPCSAMGVDYIKAIKAPLSNVKILSVGGVDVDNIDQYLNAGVCGIGIGAGIIDKKMIENDDYEGITKLAEAFTSKIKNL